MAASGPGHSSVTPSCNRLLQRKWDDMRYRQHQDRLRTMRSSVDNQAPREFVHIKQNVRKRRIADERQATIDRHNRELLSRMHTIMHTTGRVEHRNLDWKPKKSLGYIKRQEEFDRIQRENQAILKRIQTVRPQYKVKQWESDFRVHRERARSLQLFPPITTSPPKPRPKLKPIHEEVRLPPIDEQDGMVTHQATQTSEVQEDIDIET